jgi:hypothetical protein
LPLRRGSDLIVIESQAGNSRMKPASATLRNSEQAFPLKSSLLVICILISSEFSRMSIEISINRLVNTRLAARRAGHIEASADLGETRACYPVLGRQPAHRRRPDLAVEFVAAEHDGRFAVFVCHDVSPGADRA